MRKSFVRRGAAAALALFTGLATATLGASPARADVSIAGVSISKNTLILDGDAGCGDRIRVTAKVYVPLSSPDEVFSVSADVVRSGGDVVDFLLMNYQSRSGDYVTYADDVFLCGFDAPGTHQVKVEVSWWDDDLSEGREAQRSVYFKLQRPTSLSYNATPEPVRKGAKLTHSGRLLIDPVGWGPKKGVKGVALKFYFKANGAKTYAYKGATVTTSGGKYSKKITATKSGTWKVVYAGSTTRQPQVKYDAVKVR
jgi:hypothetical protein